MSTVGTFSSVSVRAFLVIYYTVEYIEMVEELFWQIVSF